MRLYFTLAIGILAVALGVSSAKTVNVGIVIDGPWPRNNEVFSLMRSEVEDLLEPEFAIEFPPEYTVTCDWTIAQIQTELERILADPEVDIIIGAGVIASQYLGTRESLPKPIIAPFVLDPEVQGIPVAQGRSGVKNLSYIVFPKSIERAVEVYREIVPFNHLVIIHLGQFHELVKSKLPPRSEMGFNLTFVPADFEVDPVLDALPEDADATYLMPMLQLSEAESNRLISELNERKLPTFSHLGEEEVERGVMAGYQADAFEVVARRIALNMQRILLGEDGGTLPVRCTVSERLLINMETARKIGVSPPWKVLTEATLVHSARETVTQEWTLKSAMETALRMNPELAAKADEIAAGKQDVGLARSNLLPQLSLDGSLVIIDDDRAEASLGSQAERTYSAGATVSQLLFSERAWANLSVQRHLHASRKSALRQAELDLSREVSIAYLELLQSKTLERLRKDNLSVTRSNMELAELREAVGSANPNEIHRWEAELASDRADVIKASAIRNIAEIQLNRLLARPAEETMTVEDLYLGSEELLVSNGKLDRYMGDPWSFRTFREFMVEKALTQSPELAQLDAAIAARKRALTSANRSYFMPTFTVQGKFSNRFEESGAGSEPAELPPAFAGLFPSADEKDWSVAIVGSFPLFQSGSKRYSQLQARFELTDLEYQRKHVADLIEQSVRAVLHAAGASHAAIGLTEDAAIAAHRSLEAVTDAYANGAVSITELLDAQNASLSADVQAENAVYTYLIDYMNVQRSVGKFDVYLTDEERADFYNRLENYFANAATNR